MSNNQVDPFAFAGLPIEHRELVWLLQADRRNTANR